MRLPVGISWTNAVCVLLLVGLATRDAGAVCGNEEEHFLHRARSLVEEGEAGRALSVLRDGLESSPEEVQGWLLVGRILGELGGYEGAVEAYGRVARDLPLLGDCALLLRSDLALEQGRTADAESGYRDALREFPGSPHARRALLGLGRAASAEGHWRRAAEALDEFLARRGSKEETIEALQLLAAARLAEDDWLGAQAAYYELWKDHPGSEEAAMAAEALEFLRTTQGLVPPVLTPEQRFGRAERLRRAGSLNQAAAEFEKIVRSSPECELVPEAVYERGMIYFRLGENGRAMECLKSLVKRYPASGAAPDGLYLMARIHWRKGFRHRFLSACEDVLERYPDTRAAENAQFALGVFYMERNKRDKALAAFHGTISGDPSHSRRHDSLWKLGWLEYRDERFEEAFASFSLLATEATSGYRKASLYWSARCQEKLGNREEVEEILRRVAASYLGDHYGIQAGERLLAMGAGDIGDRGISGPDFTLPPAWGGDNYLKIRILEDVGFYELAMEAMRPLLKGAPPGARLRFWILAKKAGEYRKAADDMEIHYQKQIETRAAGLPLEFWKLVFPLPHEEEIFAAAREFGVDPLLVAAVIREESRFDAEAVSSAGAAGLLQLMPGTARDEARRLGLRSRGLDLFDPATNIRLGTYSLGRRLERFHGNVVLALAGYNAGDQRAKRWKSELKGMEQDEFIDQIPYRETRLYIKRILTSYDHYRRTYGAECPVRGEIRIGLTEPGTPP